MAVTVIRNFIAKALFKKKGAIANNKAVEFSANALEQRIKNFGIDPNLIKNEQELNQVLSYVKQSEDAAFSQKFGDMLNRAGDINAKKGEVFDMTGNKIDTSKGIMGGKEIKPIDELQNYTKSKEDIVQDLVDRKFGKGYFDTVDESEAAIKARIEADNKKGIASMKKKLDDPEEKADGGRIGLLAGSVPKVLKLLKNKKKVQAAVDDIFPTGDYKYDAQMAADSLVENNPNTFGGKLYEDLDLDTQMEVYGAVIGPIQSNALTLSKMKKATKPEKTLASMKEGKGIDMSDPDIAEEFARFMKETDPKGSKTIEQTVELSNFDPKGRKKNSDGGRIGLFLGGNLEGGYSKSRTDSGGKQTTVSFGGGEGGNKKSPPVVTRTVTKPNVKDTIRKVGNTIGDISYFKNLINLNPYGIAKNIGGKILMDKILGDQSSLDTEDENNGIMKMADATTTPTADTMGLNLMDRKTLKDAGYSNNQIQELQNNPDINTQDVIRDIKGPIFAAADGGRIGYKAGSVDKIRRLFLKTIGAGTAGIAGAKSGIFSFGKGAGKEVAKEVAQQTTSSMPPPYFFKLAEKIKMMGNDATATTDRTIAKTLKSKDGKSTYVLEEDVTTGDTIIKKINKEGDEMITDVQIMEFRKGEDIVTKDGKAMKTPDEYEEVTEANMRIEGDTFNDPYYSDGIEEIEMKKIIDEVDDKVPSIKYAQGGLAYMLGE